MLFNPRLDLGLVPPRNAARRTEPVGLGEGAVSDPSPQGADVNRDALKYLLCGEPVTKCHGGVSLRLQMCLLCRRGT